MYLMCSARSIVLEILAWFKHFGVHILAKKNFIKDY